MKKKILYTTLVSLAIIVLLFIILTVVVMIQGPVTDCDSCLNGTTP